MVIARQSTAVLARGRRRLGTRTPAASWRGLGPAPATARHLGWAPCAPGHRRTPQSTDEVFHPYNIGHALAPLTTWRDDRCVFMGKLIIGPLRPVSVPLGWQQARSGARTLVQAALLDTAEVAGYWRRPVAAYARPSLKHLDIDAQPDAMGLRAGPALPCSRKGYPLGRHTVKALEN